MHVFHLYIYSLPWTEYIWIIQVWKYPVLLLGGCQKQLFMFRREEEKVNTILLQLCLKKTKQAACQLICGEQHFWGPHFLIFLLFIKQKKSDLLAYNIIVKGSTK